MNSPLQLQVNNKGSWKTVIFMGHGGQNLQNVMAAAQALYAASPTSHWRITTGEGRSPRVLAHMGSSTYGVWVQRGEQS